MSDDEPRMVCGNDRTVELTPGDAAMLDWFRTWLAWRNLPAGQRAETPEPADPTGQRPIADGEQATNPDDDLLERALGSVPIMFWRCPEDHPREPLRVEVDWDGDVATCLDCGRTNQPTASKPHEEETPGA